MDKVIVSAIQMSSSSDRNRNLQKADELIDIAAKRNSHIIALPELFNVFTRQDEEHKFTESIPGPTTDFISKKAKQHHVYILAGSMIEKSDSDKAYNTSVLFDREGEIIAKYRKIHLFDTAFSRKESDTRLPGNEIVTVNTELGTLGLSICYDLRFPELFKELRTKGAEIIFIPSAFILHTGKDHWETLLRARAIDNQVYIVAPNQFGKNEETGIVNYGRSLIIDPWGNVIARAYDKECVITADIEMDLVEEVRLNLGFKIGLT